jgi:hypothetical protein
MASISENEGEMQWRGENMSDESDNGSSSMWRKREKYGQLKAYCRRSAESLGESEMHGAGVWQWRGRSSGSASGAIRRRRGAQNRINRNSEESG